MKAWYQKTSDLGDAFVRFQQEISKGTSLDEKTIELIKIAVSSVLRCRHCTQVHVKYAKSIGLTAREIIDALLISSLQAAGTQLYWDGENFAKNLVTE
jgi:AhpD family alkylhydroperoxidase